MLLHIYAINDKFASRGRYYCVPSAKGKLKFLYIAGKKFYDYSKAYPAFRDRFTAWFPFSEKAYEKRKEEAIETYFDKPKGVMEKRQIAQRDRAIIYLWEMEQTAKDIAEKIKLSVAQVERVILKHKEDEKE